MSYSGLVCVKYSCYNCSRHCLLMSHDYDGDNEYYNAVALGVESLVYITKHGQNFTMRFLSGVETEI